MFRMVLGSALCALTFTAPAAAQEPDWASDQNRVWWNGVTQSELQELVAEAGGTWTDEPDQNGFRISRVDWPDLANVTIHESNCPQPERPMPERNCGTLELTVNVGIDPGGAATQSIEWARDRNRWLTYSESWGIPRLYRLEHHVFGTSRGHVLSDLVMFRLSASREIARLKALPR